VGETDFVFVRAYNSTEATSCKDAVRMPLTLRPLQWERQQARPRPAKRPTTLRVNTVPGVFLAVPVEALLQKVCIVPNYKLGGDNFLVNDLVIIASEELMITSLQQEPEGPICFASQQQAE
jgi:hypothetical protein